MPTEILGPEDRYLIAAQSIIYELNCGQSPVFDSLVIARRRERSRVRVIEDMRGLGDALLDHTETQSWLARLERDVSEWANA